MTEFEYQGNAVNFWNLNPHTFIGKLRICFEKLKIFAGCSVEFEISQKGGYDALNNI